MNSKLYTETTRSPYKLLLVMGFITGLESKRGQRFCIFNQHLAPKAGGWEKWLQISPSRTSGTDCSAEGSEGPWGTDLLTSEASWLPWLGWLQANDSGKHLPLWIVPNLCGVIIIIHFQDSNCYPKQAKQSRYPI